MRLILVGIFWVGGAVLGWDTAVVTHSTREHSAVASVQGESAAANALPHSSTLVVVSVPGQVLSADARKQKEVEKLEARNRRLEALVRVLKNRQVEKQP